MFRANKALLLLSEMIMFTEKLISYLLLSARLTLQPLSEELLYFYRPFEPVLQVWTAVGPSHSQMEIVQQTQFSKYFFHLEKVQVF